MEHRIKRELVFLRKDIKDSIMAEQLSNVHAQANVNYFDENAKLLTDIMNLCQISLLSDLFKEWRNACVYRKQLLPQGKNIFIRMNNVINASDSSDEEKAIALEKVSRVAKQLESKIQIVQAMPRC